MSDLVFSDKSPRPSGPYSQGIKVGDLLFISPGCRSALTGAKALTGLFWSYCLGEQTDKIPLSDCLVVVLLLSARKVLVCS
jgi:hypothetical protein